MLDVLDVLMGIAARTAYCRMTCGSTCSLHIYPSTILIELHVRREHLVKANVFDITGAIPAEEWEVCRQVQRLYSLLLESDE